MSDGSEWDSTGYQDGQKNPMPPPESGEWSDVLTIQQETGGRLMLRCSYFVYLLLILSSPAHPDEIYRSKPGDLRYGKEHTSWNEVSWKGGIVINGESGQPEMITCPKEGELVVKRTFSQGGWEFRVAYSPQEQRKKLLSDLSRCGVQRSLITTGDARTSELFLTGVRYRHWGCKNSREPSLGYMMLRESDPPSQLPFSRISSIHFEADVAHVTLKSGMELSGTWVGPQSQSLACKNEHAKPIEVLGFDKDAKQYVSLPMEQVFKIEFLSNDSGAQKQNPTDELQYVWIPAGTFQMGCVPGDDDCLNDEKPRHQVEITKGFWMSRTQVTVAAFQRFRGDTGTVTLGGWGDGEDHPVEHVNWNRAQEYCQWAGGRLPTEAEWEYAARGGKEGLRYPWGNEVGPQNVDHRGLLDGTKPVGSYPANGFGLYDMAGNVLEWCADWYGEEYYSSSPTRDPQGPEEGCCRGSRSPRVLRGGGWSGDGWSCSNRSKAEPLLQADNISFRCVWTTHGSSEAMEYKAAEQATRADSLRKPLSSRRSAAR